MRNQVLMAATALLAVCVLTSVSSAAITGSGHDFGSKGWSQNQICLPCHTPHNAIVEDANGVELAGPLWNHTLPANNAYDMYIGGVKTTGEVDQNSILCLSCHDGTVALDSFGGATGSNFIASSANLGTDLSNDHPIGAAAIWPTPNPTYMVDPALRDAARVMPLRPMSTGELAVGCTSCHEPHNRKNTTNMLWYNNSGSGTTLDGRSVSGSLLCMNCHKK